MVMCPDSSHIRRNSVVTSGDARLHWTAICTTTTTTRHHRHQHLQQQQQQPHGDSVSDEQLQLQLRVIASHHRIHTHTHTHTHTNKNNICVPFCTCKRLLKDYGWLATLNCDPLWVVPTKKWIRTKVRTAAAIRAVATNSVATCCYLK